MVLNRILLSHPGTPESIEVVKDISDWIEDNSNVVTELIAANPGEPIEAFSEDFGLLFTLRNYKDKEQFKLALKTYLED